MNNAAIPGILSQELFVQYAARWLETVENTDPTTLRACFAAGAEGRGGRLRAISFDMRQIVRLVSTVGAARVKASFVVLPGADARPRFSLVLSASNSLEARISSYYLAQEYQLPEEELAMSADQSTALALGATPGVLAREWTRDWNRAAQIEPAMFAGAYGYLRGYTFELSDFVAILAGVRSPDAGSLVLRFGLHEFYRPDPTAGDTLAQLFGLMLQLRDADKDRLEGDGDPIYDMGAPCPPSC